MSQWRVAIGRKQYGPYSLERLRELHREGRIPGDAQIWHPEKEEWIEARDVEEIANDAEDEDVVIMEDSFPSPKRAAEPPARSAPLPESEEQSLGDFLAFRRMITPIIIQIIFWVGAVFSSIWGIFVMIAGVQVDDFSMVFLGFFMMLLGPIVVRIYCELMIVIFRMNETLTDIRNEMKRRR